MIETAAGAYQTGGTVLNDLNWQQAAFRKEVLVISALKCALANGDSLDGFTVPGLAVRIERANDGIYLFCDDLTFQIYFADRQLLSYRLL